MKRAIAAIALALASSACVATQEGAPAVAHAGEAPNTPTQLAQVEADYQACRAVALAAGAAKEGAGGTGSASSMLPLRRRAAAEASSEDHDLSFQQAYEHGMISAQGREVAQAVMRRCMIRRGYMPRGSSPAKSVHSGTPR